MCYFISNKLYLKSDQFCGINFLRYRSVHVKTSETVSKWDLKVAKVYKLKL